MPTAEAWMKDVIERPKGLARRSEAGDREMSPMAEHPNISPASSFTPKQVKLATTLHHIRKRKKHGG